MLPWGFAPRFTLRSLSRPFSGANQRLAKIDRQIQRRLQHLQGTWNESPIERVLIDIALVEREIDRARRSFGLFFEIFSQRGSSFAAALAAHDLIAIDCYQAFASPPGIISRTDAQTLVLYGTRFLARYHASWSFADSSFGRT